MRKTPKPQTFFEIRNEWKQEEKKEDRRDKEVYTLK